MTTFYIENFFDRNRISNGAHTFTSPCFRILPTNSAALDRSKVDITRDFIGRLNILKTQGFKNFSIDTNIDKSRATTAVKIPKYPIEQPNEELCNIYAQLRDGDIKFNVVGEGILLRYNTIYNCKLEISESDEIPISTLFMSKFYDFDTFKNLITESNYELEKEKKELEELERD